MTMGSRFPELFDIIKFPPMLKDYDKEHKSVPTRSIIVQYWTDVYCEIQRDFPIEFVPNFLSFDIEEPSCWGCGFRDWEDSCEYWSWDKAKPKENRPAKHVFSNWNRLRTLHRCHIVPRSRGGGNHPSNLVLLCSLCHSEMPDIVDAKMSFVWLNKHEECVAKEYEREFNLTCDHLGIDPKEMSYMFFVLHDLADEKIRNDYDNFRLAFSSEHRGSKGGPILKVSTMVTTAYAYWQKKFSGVDPRKEFSRLVNL